MFSPQPQTEEGHEREVSQYQADPPTDAFGASLPQNIIPEKASGLAPDMCHKDSDRVDSDGLPKVGVVVWPGQTFCNKVLMLLFLSACSNSNNVS